MTRERQKPITWKSLRRSVDSHYPRKSALSSGNSLLFPNSVDMGMKHGYRLMPIRRIRIFGCNEHAISFLSVQMRSKPTFQEGKTVAERLKKAIQKKRNIRLHHVFLFGSVARKTAHEWSDIDVAVVCDQFDRSKIKEARMFYTLFPQRDVRMSLVVLHPEEMEDKYSTLAEEIRKDGVEV